MGTKKYKQLTLKERIIIEILSCLYHMKLFTHISIRLNRKLIALLPYKKTQRKRANNKSKRGVKIKNQISIIDTYHLRKRAILVTIFDQLENIYQVEHSRLRSPTNYFTNIFSALIAYNFAEKKPS